MKIMKLILIILFLVPILSKAQTTVKKVDKREFSKHEFGLSWGAFPTLGVWCGVAFRMHGGFNRYPFWGPVHPLFAHRDSDAWKGPDLIDEETGKFYNEKEFYAMRHYGTLTFNYQYHFSKRHSMGFNTTWLGRHISNYVRRAYYTVFDDLIDAKGWEHTLSLCANYRFTYYSKGIVSLYAAIHFGVAVKLIARKLLFTSEKSFYWAPVLQITGFGIAVGKTHAFVSELGIGTQGLMKIGYRYKFNNR